MQNLTGCTGWPSCKDKQHWEDKRTIPENKKYTKDTGSINKFSKMNAPIIDVNWIFETKMLKIWASEHVPLKRYWWKNCKKCITPIQNFFIFFNFSPKGKEFRPGHFAAYRAWKDAHPKFFYQKSVMFYGSRMLRYGLISDWKRKFLQAVIEKISVVYKDFYYRGWFFENYFTYPDNTCQALALTSKPNNLKLFSNFFILANFEILTLDLAIRPKITVLTLQSLRVPGCSVMEI